MVIRVDTLHSSKEGKRENYFLWTTTISSSAFPCVSRADLARQENVGRKGQHGGALLQPRLPI
jgi:hypothetical protein